MDKNSRRAIRSRLLRQNLNWWKGDRQELSNTNIDYLRNTLDIEYRRDNRQFYNLLAQNQKSVNKDRGMKRCTNCVTKGIICSGPTSRNSNMDMCVQCAVAGLEEKDCVYSSLNLALPAWAKGDGASNIPIQPAVPNRNGAGLAIRIPSARNEGKGSPTGFMEDVDENEGYNENATNSNASRDPKATAEQVARGRAKKEARRKKVSNNLAKSALNNMAAGNESAKAVQAMAAAAGAGKRNHKSRKQKNRKQKFTRKQK